MASVGVMVGSRLLLLARRTRELPELTLGLGLVLVAVLGGPLAAVARLPGLVGTASGTMLFGVGLALTHLGIGLFFLFTWRVFRRDTFGAMVAVLLAAAALGGEWVGLMSATLGGGTMEEIFPRSRPWGIAVVTTLALSFLWTAVESFRYYDRLRRRVALGLADPVVANRFLLWALAGLAVVIVCGAVAASMLLGIPPMVNPLPLACIAFAAIAVSVCWTLAFLPPERYLEILRRGVASA